MLNGARRPSTMWSHGAATLASMQSLLALLRHHEMRRAARFVTTGVIAFTIDFGGLVILHGSLGLPLGLAVIAPYPVGTAVHYALTRWWVFPPGAPGSEAGRFARYLLLVAANGIGSVAIVLSLTSLGMDYRVAKLLSVAVLVTANYLVSPVLVMRSPERSFNRR